MPMRVYPCWCLHIEARPLAMYEVLSSTEPAGQCLLLKLDARDYDVAQAALKYMSAASQMGLTNIGCRCSDPYSCIGIPSAMTAGCSLPF